jgi:hypothetical protein
MRPSQILRSKLTPKEWDDVYLEFSGGETDIEVADKINHLAAAIKKLDGFPVNQVSMNQAIYLMLRWKTGAQEQGYFFSVAIENHAIPYFYWEFSISGSKYNIFFQFNGKNFYLTANRILTCAKIE